MVAPTSTPGAAAEVRIDFSDPAIRADPIAIYAQLRAESPIFWNGPQQGWLVSRYADAVALFTDARMSSQRADAAFASLTPEQREELTPLRNVLLNRMLLTDPPRHTRLKNLVMPAFSMKAATGRRERIEALCLGFVNAVTERGQADETPVVDIMRDIAAPLPSWVIADTLGVPMDEQADFTRWASAQVAVYDRPGTIHNRVEVMRGAQQALLEMRAYLEGIIAARRESPQEDLLSALVQAEAGGDRLSTDELVAMCVALLIGGNNSTAHAIGNCIYTLLRHPEALQQLREQPQLVRSAVEEVLRFESPVQATSRVAKEDIELHGETIRAGQNVSLLIASANRDADQFPDPDTFLITRQPNRHLTFAHGPHFCLGSALARNVTQVAVQTLVQHLPNMRLVDDAPHWAPGFSFKHLETLRVTYDA